jgi:hypothetical protein
MSDLANDTTGFNAIAFFHIETMEVAVDCTPPRPMVDDYGLTVVSLVSGFGDLAGPCHDWRSFRGGPVNSGVHFHLLQQWVKEHSEGGREFGAGEEDRLIGLEPNLIGLAQLARNNTPCMNERERYYENASPHDPAPAGNAW